MLVSLKVGIQKYHFTVDPFFLLLNGLNNFDFGSKYNLEECVENLFIGAQPIDNNINGGLEANLALCTAEEKELGWAPR